jgi:hypothetical protein
MAVLMTSGAGQYLISVVKYTQFLKGALHSYIKFIEAHAN